MRLGELLDSRQQVSRERLILSLIHIFESEHMEASYCDVPEIANHEVCIVGWDDTYSRDKFKDGTGPQRDGAWIVKNSWGTGYHKAGDVYKRQALTRCISWPAEPLITPGL